MDGVSTIRASGHVAQARPSLFETSADVFLRNRDIGQEVFGPSTVVVGCASRDEMDAVAGVEVCTSMQHGGPYPATTDARSTSVGTAAIHRFARPIAYQGFPEPLLPIELQDANPRGIWRLVDGEMTRSTR